MNRSAGVSLGVSLPIRTGGTPSQPAPQRLRYTRVPLDLRSGFAHTPATLQSKSHDQPKAAHHNECDSTEVSPPILIMANVLDLRIKNSLEALHSAVNTMSDWLAGQNVPEAIQHFAHLALEEFVTNSIKYGYDDTQEHSIEVNIRLSKAELVLTLVDDGRPFNPLEAPEPQLDLPLEERPIGGLGIYLVRKMSDRMTYVREEGTNRLTLHKAFGE